MTDVATPGFLIIDARKDGLPDAPVYYRTFPAEQSPLGEISLSQAKTLAMTNSSLDVALDGMLTAGARAVVVLVCHAYSDGLLLPIAPGGKTALAVKDNMALIDRVIKAQAEGAAITALPTTTSQQQQAVIDRWTKLLNDLQPGSVQGQFTTKEAQAFFDKWLDMEARNMEIRSRADLQKLTAKVLKVRALKLSRLELRACNIGKKSDTMDAVRKFFGADFLTAPTVSTFYMGLLPVSTMAVRVSPRRNRNISGSGSVVRGGTIAASRTPGPVGSVQGIEVVANDGEPTLVLANIPSNVDIVSDQKLEAQTDHTTRGFFKRSFMYFVGPFMGVHISTFHMFALTIDETAAFEYRGFVSVFSTGDGVTPDWSKVREFVQGWILPAAAYHHGPFPVAGLWTPDVQDVPFVLPYETMYVGLIAQSP
jgi:hypothetical protein